MQLHFFIIIFCFRHHPDIQTEKNEEQEIMFQTILEAFTILKDPAKRKKYDNTGVIPNK
jgi:DnaJ-class molecular chaperone